MLIQLTEMFPGIVNPNVVINKQIAINNKCIQSIRLMLKSYPYKESYTEITMTSGEKINVQEKYNEVCKMLKL